MNFYDVLAAEKWGGGIPTMNFFDLLFAQSISGEQWQVYEGTLPATINANGSDMRQYQVWGTVGGVGDKTAQLLDKNSAYEAGYYTSSGTFVNSDGVITYDYFPVEALKEYFYKAFYATPSSAESERTIRVNFFDSQKSFISRFLDIGTALSIKNVTTPQNCAFVRLSVNKILSNIVFGTVLFETFVPFGYEVDMSTSDGTSTTTTPIYIGDEPLDKDEYIDYQAGKIYRMINGTLTPTDPPVALPALPTCEGTTVIDYAGQSVAPEKVLLEYAKGGN